MSEENPDDIIQLRDTATSENVNSAETQKKFQGKALLMEMFCPCAENANSGERAPMWLACVGALALFLMLNQVKLPVAGGKLCVGDIAFIVAFIPVVIYCLQKCKSIFYPVLSVFALLAVCIANLTAASGVGGAIEAAQLIQQILCGTLLLSFFVEYAPWTCIFAVGLSLLINIIVAVLQLKTYAFGSVYPPADILKLKWGFGGAYTGIFRSRMAFSFFLAMCIAWLQPVIYGRKKMLGLVGGALLTVLCLVAMPNGQMLFITVIVLLVGAILHSRIACWFTVASVALFLAVLVAVKPAHRDVIIESFNPIKAGEYTGELKTNHLDFAAAINMAIRKPFCGVGSGCYQQCVGRCYGSLPNPSYNDIDTDTQASWGILAGTTGFITTALFFLMLSSSAVWGIRRFIKSNGENCIALSGAMLLFVTMAGMCVSDPFTRGLGWMVALGLASVAVPNLSEEISSWWRISIPSIIVVGLVMGLLLGAIVVRHQAEDPLAGTSQYIASVDEDDEFLMGTSSNDTFVIIDAGEAIRITAPMVKVQNSQASKGIALDIPDGKGTPPDDGEPDMKYGGAEFKLNLAEDAECKIWVRVWWDGSCGNTLNLQLDDEPKSVTVGNDGAYRVWHWLEAPKIYKLKAGEHIIRLLNREDGIMFDQMLITGDLQYVPQGIEEE